VSESPPAPVAPRGLISTPPAQYGTAFQAHLLEQYKLYVEQASRISDRRTTANTFLLTVNTSLIALYSLATSALSTRADAWYFFVPFAGVVLCIAWWQLLRSYRNLNTVKFRVIHELEQHLPAALFAYEWDQAEQGRGEAYTPFTHVEPAIPWIFFGLYLAAMYLALR
jgi:hypothetical protein